jgi:hypothetical protein
MFGILKQPVASQNELETASPIRLERLMWFKHAFVWKRELLISAQSTGESITRGGVGGLEIFCPVLLKMRPDY